MNWDFDTGYEYTFVFDEDEAKVYTDYTKTNLYREEIIHVLIVEDEAQGYPHYYCNVEM